MNFFDALAAAVENSVAIFFLFARRTDKTAIVAPTAPRKLNFSILTCMQNRASVGQSLGEQPCQRDSDAERHTEFCRARELELERSKLHLSSPSRLNEPSGCRPWRRLLSRGRRSRTTRYRARLRGSARVLYRPPLVEHERAVPATILSR